MIIECKVWCVGNSRALVDMGLPEGDSWMPFAVDFCKVDIIKLAGESDFLGNDKACIYVSGDNFTLDISFIEAIKLWKEAMKCD